MLLVISSGHDSNRSNFPILSANNIAHMFGVILSGVLTFVRTCNAMGDDLDGRWKSKKESLNLKKATHKKRAKGTGMFQMRQHLGHPCAFLPAHC